MTSWYLMPLLGLMALGKRAQIANPEKGKRVERPCGKVEWVNEIPLRDYPGIFGGKRKPIRKTTITVFHGENESSVCGALFATAVANGEGQFKCKNPAPAKYWVMFALKDKLRHIHTTSLRGELQLRRVIQLD